jgi:large subunit ribosomal protein L17
MLNNFMRSPAMRNMAFQLVTHGEVETTLTRAKMLKTIADKLITIGKENSLSARRRIQSVPGSEELAQKLQFDMSTRYQTRRGGYTRVRVTRTRKGDSVTLAKVQFMPEAS